MNVKPLQCLAITVLSATLLAACGGGSSGSSDDSSSSDSGGLQSTTSSTSSSSSAGSSSSSSTSVTSSGSTVSASWSVPTQREDGSPLMASDLRGYEIYYYKSGTPQSQGTVIAINNPTQTSHTTGVLSPGTYFFAISSVDSNGVYSQLSNYVSVTVL